MKKLNLILVLVLFGTGVFVSCKKEKVIEIPEPAKSTLNIAPCGMDCASYSSFAIDSSASSNFPQAKYIIRFFGASNSIGTVPSEFAFNKIPTTGMYYMVIDIDTTDQLKLNQMATFRDSGSFTTRSTPTNFPIIYIENNASDFIISYCNIPYADTFAFSSSMNCWIGNSPASLRIQIKK